MTTLAKIAEQALRLYYGGDIPNENGLQIEDAMLAAAQAINFLQRQSLEEKVRKTGEQTIDSLFIATYEDVAVQFNSRRNKYFVQLPAKPVHLRHSLGVYQVSDMEESLAFIPLGSGWLTMIGKEADAAYLEGNVGFQHEADKIYFVCNFAEHAATLKTVLVKLVNSISDYDEDDELPIPPDFESQVIEYLLKTFRGVPPNDKVNDNKQQL